MRCPDLSISRHLLLVALVATSACGDADRPLPEGDVLLVSSVYDDMVRVLDPATGEVLNRVDVDPREAARDEPADVAVSNEGTSWYVVLGETPATLWEFFGTEATPTRRIRLPGFRNASRIAISPDEDLAVITEYFLGDPEQPGLLAVVSLEQGRVARTRPCVTPYDIAFNARGTAAAVSCPLGDEVVVLRGETFALEARFPALTPDQTSGRVGNPVSRPMGLAWSPGGDRIFVALYDRGSIGVFTPQGDFVREIPLEARPLNLVVPGTGRYVVAVTREPPSVAVVDTRSGEAMVMPLPDAEAPHALAISPDGRTAFVAWEGGPTSPGGVTAVDLDGGEILWTRETGPMTTGIAYRSGRSSG